MTKTSLIRLIITFPDQIRQKSSQTRRELMQISRRATQNLRFFIDYDIDICGINNNDTDYSKGDQTYNDYDDFNDNDIIVITQPKESTHEPLEVE